MICFEDQTVETLNDMRETIISKLTILSPGQGNQAEVGTETTTVQNVIDKQEINTTTTMEEVEGDNPNIDQISKYNTKKEQYFVGSCGQPSGAEREPGGKLRIQEPGKSSGQEERGAAAPAAPAAGQASPSPPTKCQEVPRRRVLVPGRGRSTRRQREGTIAVRRVDDLLKLMTSQKRKQENECVENGGVSKKTRT